MNAYLGYPSQNIREEIERRYPKNYLYFQSEEEGSTISLAKLGSPYEVTLVSSDNGIDWGDYTIGNTYVYPQVGSRFYLKKADSDTSDKFSKRGAGFYNFSMSGKIAAYGNIQWLLDCTGQSLSCSYYCYIWLFSDCSSLTQAPELPATMLADGCYYDMFNKCISLTKAPELPATMLADGCYCGMFKKCISLTKAPELPATIMKFSCYNSMFNNCYDLSVTTDSTKTGAYQILSVSSTTAYLWGYNMFNGTAGDFTGTPTTGVAYYCYGN